MRSPYPWPALCALVLVACSDQAAPPTEAPAPGPEASPATPSMARDDARLERLARRTARALRRADFRAEVAEAIRQSPFREGKVHYQRYLQADGGRRLRLVAAENGEAAGDVATETARSGVLEFYFPVPEHRARWTGDENLLVATAARDGDAPVAFDLAGRRHVLDPAHPPALPVLAVVPAELDFDAPPEVSMAKCQLDECAGGGGASVVQAPGLYMSRVEFRDDFEGWLKGQPEFEIHILGPAAPGDTKNLTGLQCIAANAPPPYTWDSNSLLWEGSQILFSRAQIDAFERTHPGKPFTIMAYEDDDTACTIKTDRDRISAVLAAAGPASNDFKGAITAPVGVGSGDRYLAAAKSGYLFLTALWNFITTADEVIGVAVNDAATGRYRAGTNWTFLGENAVHNGWIQLDIVN